VSSTAKPALTEPRVWLFTAFLLLSRRVRADAIVSDDLVYRVRQLGAPNHWRVIDGVDSWRPCRIWRKETFISRGQSVTNHHLYPVKDIKRRVILLNDLYPSSFHPARHLTKNKTHAVVVLSSAFHRWAIPAAASGYWGTYKGRSIGRLKLPYGRCYSPRRIHLITVVRSVGSVQVVVQQSPKPSFNPSSHQPSFPLSPRIPHALPTAVSTVGPAPLNVRLTISQQNSENLRSERERRDETAHELIAFVRLSDSDRCERAG
jgi:hypothetical protein